MDSSVVSQCGVNVVKLHLDLAGCGFDSLFVLGHLRSCAGLRGGFAFVLFVQFVTNFGFCLLYVRLDFCLLGFRQTFSPELLNVLLEVSVPLIKQNLPLLFNKALHLQNLLLLFFHFW